MLSIKEIDILLKEVGVMARISGDTFTAYTHDTKMVRIQHKLIASLIVKLFDNAEKLEPDTTTLKARKKFRIVKS